MVSLLILLIPFFLVAVLNIMLRKNSKKCGKKILWQHRLFGYLFILYLMINLVQVGVPSWFECKISLNQGQPIFHTDNMNLVPFKDSLDITSILNIILFMPFGIFLPTLWDKYRKLLPTFCYGFTFSLIIEVSQLFTRNRTFDINDLIFNTLGTVCGWVVFNSLRKIFYKLADKTVVKSLPSDTFISKLEPHLYIVIVFICGFFSY